MGYHSQKEIKGKSPLISKVVEGRRMNQASKTKGLSMMVVNP